MIFNISVFLWANRETESFVWQNGRSNKGEEVINNVRYPDDSVIIAERMKDLQILLDRVYEADRIWGINIIKKTKWMILGEINIEPIKLTLHN